MLDSDGGNERLRTVSSRHSETIRPAGNGISRQLFEVQALFEGHHLDTLCSGLFGNLEGNNFSAARLRIADQHWLRWCPCLHRGVIVG